MQFRPKMLIPVLAIAGMAFVFYAKLRKAKKTYQIKWGPAHPGYPGRDTTRVRQSTLTRVRQSTLNRPPQEQETMAVWPHPRESRAPRGPGTGVHTSPRNFYQGETTGSPSWTTDDGPGAGTAQGQGQGAGVQQLHALHVAPLHPVQHTQMGVTGTAGTGGFLG